MRAPGVTSEKPACSEKPPVVVIAGPTGVGKTNTAIGLAEAVGGEIIGADAMQVYRHMDIGTAKPTPEQRARVRHHLVNVVDPDEPFSAARFKQLAERVIKDLHRAGVLPFVVGGTGLYIKALTRGLFETDEVDEPIRARLLSEAEKRGIAALYARLEAVDPNAALRIHPNDRYRIIRALEVFEATGHPISLLQKRHDFSDEPYRVLKVGLFLERAVLYDRIDRRVDEMMASGLIEEVKTLLNHGFCPELKSMQSIGYRHVIAFLQGEVTRHDMVEQLKRDTRRYAKRQLTWFRADPEMIWFEPLDVDSILQEVQAFLGQKA